MIFFLNKVVIKFYFSPRVKILGRLVQKWPRKRQKSQKPEKWTLKNVFSQKGPIFWTFETTFWILTSNRPFWPVPIYWDINFVLMCLPELAHNLWEAADSLWNRYFEICCLLHLTFLLTECILSPSIGFGQPKHSQNRPVTNSCPKGVCSPMYNGYLTFLDLSQYLFVSK